MKFIYHLLRFLFWLVCRVALGAVCFAILVVILLISGVVDALIDAWADYNRKKP